MDRPLLCPPADRRAGFTMTELLMVLVLLGTMTVIVAPRIDLPHYGIDAGMQLVATTLQTAQRDAVSRQQEVLVSFDTANRRLLIHWDANGDHTVQSGERVRVVGLPDGVTFGRPTGVTARAFGSTAVAFRTINALPTLVFHRNGSASESSGLYLTSIRATRPGAARPDDTRAIEFDRATGRLDWYRYLGAWRRGF